jgi:hypothetical protein
LPAAQDLENTIGSWDMYGQEDKNRYNGLQVRALPQRCCWQCAWARWGNGRGMSAV